MKKRILAGLLILTVICTAQALTANPHILIYTRNSQGYIHDNIPACVECVKAICRANGWTFETTAVDDSSIFNDAEKIASFDVLVFANTNNDAFENDQQREVFQQYIRSGGGFVGIHSACGSERNWPWFWANLGGKFVRHPPFQKFDVVVIDKTHCSTVHLPAVWQWEDEFYYMNELNPRIKILLAGDLRTVEDNQKDRYPGRVFGDYFPLAWCQEFDGGRQWYTALGHKIEHYQDPDFIKHLEGGIRWAFGDKASQNSTVENKEQ